MARSDHRFSWRWRLSDGFPAPGIAPNGLKVFGTFVCGSASFPIGYTVFVRNCRLWHPNVDYDEPVFSLNPRYGNALCLTAGDFVLDGTGLPDKSVVDMELAYIAAMGFERLESIKFVSDNLSLRQYNEMTNNHA